MKNSKGFTLIEGMLILVVVGLLGGTGWYVWNAKQESDKSLNQASQTEIVTAGKKSESKKIEALKEESADWKEVKFQKLKYSIRIPDGWKLSYRFEKHDGGSSESLYTLDEDNIVYKKGQPAEITDVSNSGGSDAGLVPFSLGFHDNNYQLSKRGTKQGSFKTKSGLEVEKYTFEQTGEPDGIDIPKGAKEYKYYVNLGAWTLVVTHDVASGGTEQTSYIEKAIKTFKAE